MISPNKHTEYLQYKFTPEELRQLGQDMARKHQDLEHLRLKKKQVTKDLDAQISRVEAEISDNSRKLNEGSEYRDIECAVAMNHPRVGYKTITRKDTWEVVKIDPMTSSEMQGHLFDGPGSGIKTESEVRAEEKEAFETFAATPDAESSVVQTTDASEGAETPAPTEPPRTWPTPDAFGEFPMESAEVAAIYPTIGKDPEGTAAEIRVLQISETDWAFGVKVAVGGRDLLEMAPDQDATTDTKPLAIREGYIEASRALINARNDLSPRAKQRAVYERMIEWLKNDVKPLCGEERGMTLAAQAIWDTCDLDGNEPEGDDSRG